MTAPIRASGLLRTAEHLAGADAGPGRPSQSDLRRATSSAYYALFHQLIRHAVLSVLPWADEAEIAHGGRWFDHGAFRRVSDVVADAADPATTVKKERRSEAFILRTSWNDPIPAPVVLLAESFVVLHDARHSADYDNDYGPVRASTLNHVATAREAVDTVRRLWDQYRHDVWDPEADSYRRFLLLAVMHSNGPRTRS